MDTPSLIAHFTDSFADKDAAPLIKSLFEQGIIDEENMRYWLVWMEFPALSQKVGNMAAYRELGRKYRFSSAYIREIIKHQIDRFRVAA
jgi:hypothetical protein